MKIAIGAFACTAAIVLVLMNLLGFAPFGGLSVANDDAVIQYLDFFAYLQRLLAGDASWTFSFDKGLGGNVFAVLTYYLFSPLNILIVLFERTELHSFYALLVVLKLSLSSSTMALYLINRFDRQLSCGMTFLLSCSFGLMQYNLEQAKNIMWLDGVWLLPLILLGLDRLRRRNDPLLFTLSAAVSIVFNWYSGLISVMFAGLFSAWEFIFCSEDFRWKNFFRFELKVAGSIALALGLSSIILVPTLGALSSGRAGIDWHELNFQYHGKPLNIFDGFTWGMLSQKDQAVLFTGDLVTFAAAAFFLRRSLSRRLMLGGLVLLSVIWLMFYWQPMFLLFSLLKSAMSYWYRYSYLASFMLIFLTSNFLLDRERLPRRPVTFIVLLIYPTVVLAHQLHSPFNYWIGVLGSLSVYATCAAYFLILPSKKIFSTALIILVMLGLTFNAAVVMTRTAYHNVEDYQQYSRQQMEQVERLKAFDDDAYRVTQSRPGVYSNHEIIEAYYTANYNEGAAYGYRPLASYTSSPVNTQLRLLDRLGYRQNGDNMNVVNVPVLPTDSLLGVRYVFSDIEVEGLKSLDELGTLNGKMIYRNEFALPLAFVCDGYEFDELDYDGNPFEYTNQFYSELVGERVDVYRAVKYSTRKASDTELVLELDTGKAAYGNVPTAHDYDGAISIDGCERYGWSRWLGMSVFYIPRGTKALTFKTEKPLDCDTEPQIYVMDDEVLSAIAEQIRRRAAEVLLFEDEHVMLKVNGRHGEKLFTSLPADAGWSATLNGRAVEPTLIADCLMGFELDDGENIIELRYSLPRLTVGLVLLVVSAMLLAAWMYEVKVCRP